MQNEKIPVSQKLLVGIKKLCEENKAIFLVSLCTTDGFSIQSVMSKDLSSEADKLAAMSSTISALSDSSAKQVFQNECNITIVETTSGNMLFVKTTYLGLPCVLTIAARAKLALATARHKTTVFAKEISEITV